MFSERTPAAQPGDFPAELGGLGLRCRVPVRAGTVALVAWPGLRSAPDGTPWIDPEDAARLLEGLAAIGTTHILGLCEARELPPGAVVLWRDAARAAGLEAHHLPIIDYQPPDAAFAQGWAHLSPRLHDALGRGETVALCCLFGAGRSGTITALLQHEAGLPMPDAIARTRAGFAPAIESPEQEAWLLGHP